MKRFLFLATSVTLLFAGSCKKKDDGGGGSSNAITVSGTAYAVSSSLSGGNTVSFTSANGGSPVAMGLYFTGTPVSGTYHSTTSLSGSSDIAIALSVTSGGAVTAYAYEGSSVNITITVNNGKISAVVPEIQMTKGAGSGPDNVKMSANVTQP